MTDPVLGLLAMLGLMEEAGRQPQSGPPGPPYVPSQPPPGGGTAPPVTPGVTPTPTPGVGPSVVTPATPPGVTPAPVPGSSPPMPPWPTAPVPADLPPFPGAGWCPDTPVTPPVAARAAYWNGFLWDQSAKTIRRPFVQEQFGGQWVTFAAQWHPGNAGAKTFMATEAWRVCTQPPVAPQPSPLGPTGPLQQAAQAMNVALLAHGYKQADQPVYKAFQRAAGLGADGFPGTHTMQSLEATLAAMGQTIAPVKRYPWSSSGAYDGVNAPTQAEWSGAAPAAAPAAAAPGAMPATVMPYPGSGAWKTNAAYISRYQAALTWLARIAGQPQVDPHGVDGKYGPNTASAVKAFQVTVNLPQDGQVGPATAQAIDHAVETFAPTN